MVFAVNGMVRWKGEKLANGIDGKFETNSERVITRLQTLGFKEYSTFHNQDVVETVVEKEIVQEKIATQEKFKCDICGIESNTKAGIASHKRFNHKEVIQ